MPNNFDNIISMTTRPGDTRLYVTTQQGTIFAVNQSGNGIGTPEAWFDVGDALENTTERELVGNDGHDGLQSVAFHPDFINDASPGYGKLYTTMMESRPDNPANHHYLGDASCCNNQTDSVLAEWTYNHVSGEVVEDSYRELFRVRLPVRDHMIKQARFNYHAQPGEDDYGLLYVTHGDSSSQQSTEDRPLLLNHASGKMLRIDPLAAESAPYSIPGSNPFAGSDDPDVLQEIFAYGFRNPHTFSFNPDDEGNVHILVGDIGRSNIEEVNLVVNGGNYGWTKREGTFVHEQTTVNVNNPNNPPPNADAGYILGVEDLPADEATVGVDDQGNNYIYPVAQWDHNDDDVYIGQDFTATAIASGFVIRNGSDPELHNQFIHHNFSFNHGDVYHNDFDDILAAVTQLDADDPGRDEPGELTQAENFRLHLAFDHDNDPETPPEMFDDFNELLNPSFARNDGRYGEGVFGEMYISTKENDIRTVYLVTNTLPLFGDYNRNGLVDAADYVVWRNSQGDTGYHLAADGNGDGTVDNDDYDVWVNHFGDTWPNAGSGSAIAPAVALVPEPNTLLLAILAAFTFGIRANTKSEIRNKYE
jgi:hypothetical protein